MTMEKEVIINTTRDLENWLSDPEIELERAVINLSPTIAKYILDNLTGKNRNEYKTHVNSLSKQMNLNWIPLHPSSLMYFDIDGKMREGQHRCLGVLKSGKTIAVYAHKNTPEEYLKVVGNVKARSLADTLAMFGNDSPTDAKRKAAAVQVIIKYASGQNYQVSEDMYKRAEEALDSDNITAIVDISRAKVTAPVKAALILARPLDPEKIDLLARRLHDRVLLPGTEEAIGRAMTNKKNNKRYWGVFERTCKGIVAYLDNENVEILKEGIGGYEAIVGRRNNRGLRTDFV